MSIDNIIRAWKDAEYWSSLSEEERILLPGNPVGLIELNHVELNAVIGGRDLGTFTRIPCSAVDACPSALACTLKAVCD